MDRRDPVAVLRDGSRPGGEVEAVGMRELAIIATGDLETNLDPKTRPMRGPMLIGGHGREVERTLDHHGGPWGRRRPSLLWVPIGDVG